MTTEQLRTSTETTVEAPDFSIDDLIRETFDSPEFQTTHKGLDPKKVIAELPEDGRKLLSNLRSDYSRKTAELAKQKKELDRKQEDIMNSSLQKLREKMNISDDIDIYSEDGLNKYVEAKVARALVEQQAPLVEKMQEERKREELLTFKAAHPDIEDMKEDIFEVLRGGEASDVRSAYWIAKGKRAETDKTSAENAAREAKRSQREAASKVSTGLSGQAKPTPPKNAIEAYDRIKRAGRA